MEERVASFNKNNRKSKKQKKKIELENAQKLVI